LWNVRTDGHNKSVSYTLQCSLSHAASEDAPPLSLVRSNLRDVPCLACTDVCDPVIVFECDGDKNGHVICVDCFVDYCLSRLNERRFLLDDVAGYTLDCPVGCPGSREDAI
jgi:parkin